jgi:diguanylate cyclase (GGDEF)-like protein
MPRETPKRNALSLDSTTDALRSSIPWITLSATVALTFAGWIGLERSRLDGARAQFERHTQAAEIAMRTRMLTYEQVVRAGAAHVGSSPGITRASWRDFVGQVQVRERFPGVNVLGFAERVPAAVRGAHVKRMRSEGHFLDYEIHPPGTRAQYFPVALSEPPTRLSARLAGYDAFAEPVRRDAMERARDSGEATITGKVTLAGDAYRSAQSIQPGFIMYVPVYRGETVPATREARAEALSGFVFAVFRAFDLMRGILDERAQQAVDMRVYDGPPDGPGTELVDTRRSAGDKGGAFTPAFTRVATFPIGGRTWSVVFSSRPEYDAMVASSRSWGVLASGLTASLLLFILTVMLVATWNRAHQLSMRDPLTGLYNRRYLDETIGRELPRARRLRESVGVIALDIDHFKRLNDSFGHDAGDFVLRMLAEQIRAATRDSDIACRFGGEEFGIILPGASIAVARARAEGLRAAVESLRLQFEGKSLGPFTISAGVASMPPHAQDWTFTLQTADRALYAAKEQGRNRVVAAS